MDSVLSPRASQEALPPAIRGEPPPRHGGPVALLRFLRANGMLRWGYAKLALRLLWLKLRFRERLHTDGIAFVGPGVQFEIGRECIVADRAMLIDFDHGVVETDRPVREQGIYKRDVRIGHNVWVGYGACFLRGVTVGDNTVVGTYAVVNRDVPDNAVVAGVPARILRMRDAPRTMRWS